MEKPIRDNYINDLELFYALLDEYILNIEKENYLTQSTNKILTEEKKELKTIIENESGITDGIEMIKHKAWRKGVKHCIRELKEQL